MPLIYMLAGGFLVALGVKLGQAGEEGIMPPTGAESNTQISPDNWWVEGDESPKEMGFRA